MDKLECLYDSANLKLVQNLAVLLDPDPDQIANTARPNKLAAMSKTLHSYSVISIERATTRETSYLWSQ